MIFFFNLLNNVYKKQVFIHPYSRKYKNTISSLNFIGGNAKNNYRLYKSTSVFLETKQKMCVCKAQILCSLESK